MTASRYNAEIANRIAELRKDPKNTVAGICKEVDISIETFYKWKEKPEYSEALKKAEAERHKTYSEIIENSLLKKIEGFYIEEEITDVVKGENGQPEIKYKRKMKKYIPPSDTAIIFGAKNILGDIYKDRMIQTHEGEIKYRRLLDD